MFSMPDILVILAVVLIVFGPGKLPDIGASLGKGIRNFKKASEDEIPAEKAEELEHKLPPSDKTPTAGNQPG